MNKNTLCPTCDQALPDGHAFFVGDLIEKSFTGYGDAWTSWSEEEEGYSNTYPAIGEVTLIAKTPDLAEAQGADNRPIFMIFENNGRYFRKNGTADSYGEETWNGPFKDAKQVTKQVVAWE